VVAVDPVTRTAEMMTRNRFSVRVNCAYAVGDAVVTPAIGEQWYIERFDMEWRLAGRIPFNDPALNVEPEPGQVLVGSAKGPLELVGTIVRTHAPLVLDDVWYRDTGVRLERSPDGGTTWLPVSSGGSGGGGDLTSTDDLPEGLVNKYYTDARAIAAAPVKSVAGKTGVVTLAKGDVGLSNVDNTSDNDKPISSAVATALTTKADLVGGKVPASQLPVPPVAEYPDMLSFPAPGASGTIYIAADTGNLYRWDSVAESFELIVSATGGGAASTDELPEGTGNLYFTNARVTTQVQAMFGDTAGSVTEGNDPRLSDTRTPTDNTVTTAKLVDEAVTTAKLADESVTLDKLATDVQAALAASPYDVSFPQTLGQRAVGYGQNSIGVKLVRPVTFTEVTYRCGTADASGSTTVVLHRNGTPIADSAATIAAANQVAGTTVTGSWAFDDGDVLTVAITAVGTTPGLGLVADLKGNA